MSDSYNFYLVRRALGQWSSGIHSNLRLCTRPICFYWKLDLKRWKNRIKLVWKSVDSWRHNLNFSLTCFMLGELQWMFIILYNVSWSWYSGRIHKLCYLGMVFLKVLKLTSCLVKRNGHINNKSNYACHLIPILRVTLRFKLLHVETAHFSTNVSSENMSFDPKKSIHLGICTEKLDYTLYSDFTIARWSISLVFNRESLELVEIFADNREFVHFKSWFSQHRTIYKVKINSEW